jgi:AraC family transcriptional activator of tynA and feaB
MGCGVVLTFGRTDDVTTRLDRWKDLIRENFVALDIAADRDTAFVGGVRSSLLAHLEVSDVHSITQDAIRTRGLARCDDTSYLQVGLVTEGTAVLRQDGRECVLRPGDFALYETSRPFAWGLRGSWRLFVYTWPRPAFLLREDEMTSLTARALPGTDGLSGIVSRTLRDLVTATPELSSAGSMRLADEIGELVITTATELGPAPYPSTPQQAILQHIDRYIVEHLSEPNLHPASIAAAHFISTRQLHRLFAARGDTVSRLIRQLRLERCRRDLLSGHSGKQSIGEIALRWGFTNPAQLSRAFRTAYGISPRRFEAQAHRRP